MSYHLLDDNELLAMIMQRDDKAFTALYKRYWGFVYFQVNKMLRNEEQTKDVVQEIFITIWNLDSKIDIKYSLKPYLFTAVRNRVLNIIRQERTRTNYLDLFSLYLNTHQNTIFDCLNEKELLQEIDTIIDKLPPRTKEIFQLSRASYKSHKEIASQLGISEGTVSNQVTKALAILKSMLNRHK